MLLKKSKKLTLHRIERTHPVLDFIGRNLDSFQHLEGISIECQTRFLSHLVNLEKLKNIKALTFHQAYYDQDSNEMFAVCTNLIKSLSHPLAELSFQPVHSGNMLSFLNECHAKLAKLEKLDIVV